MIRKNHRLFTLHTPTTNNNYTMARPLTEDEVASIREKTADVLETLQKETASEDAPVTSWLDQEPLSPPATSEDCRFFHQHGFLVVPNFVDSTEIFNLKQQMATMAQDWDPLENTIAFGTDQESNQVQTSNDYFLESASRVHFFAEPSALCKETGALLPQFQTDKLGALNKAGHGMHMIPGPFHDYATSDKISSVVLALLGWKDPVVPQSMYIFKQATVGGAVNSHQDSTFLYTTPRQSCLGLWLALDDSTLHNGCLWVRPKSHRETVRRVLKRNPDYFGEAAIQQSSNVAEGDTSQPKMVMETLQEDEQVPWEGLLPEGSDPPCDGLLQAGFIPVECKAGDLLCFPGQLDHLSLPNNSDAPRHTFQLHLVEGEAAGVTWSKNNWLQYPPGTPFLSIKKE